MKRSLFFLLLLPLFLCAQKLPSIDEKTKDLKKYPGYLTFYWDEAGGKVWLEIDKLDSELLYVSSLPAGLGSNDVGLDRGSLGNQKIIKFSKVGRKVLMIQPNYQYRAVTSDAAERAAVEQSFAQSTIWGFAVEAESGNKLLVDATDFLLRDAVKAAQRIKALKQGTYVFDKTRSALYLPNIKNFPQNTELEATITLVNNDGEVGPFVQSVTPSPEAITLRMHHSFIQLPDGDYVPRAFDARAGYFPLSYYDYSTPVSQSLEKFFITRHRLKKKDPSATLSDPVKPIIYYIDNATPEPIRSALMEGAKWWNGAFEAAGYRNAFQVKILPADADPMDVRYNMVNWVHRSTRGWSYGASIIDPRTGEIIKGNVTLGSLRVRQDYLIAQGLLAPYENGTPVDDKMLKMALERMKQLAAHEIGHTLGLAHNYESSIANRASVMDYPHPLIRLTANGEIDMANAYTKEIGDWDKVAITYGYQDFGPGVDVTKTLDKLLKEAAQKNLQFISDQDARAPGGLHPYAHLWDNGKNAVDELAEVLKVRSKALAQFGESNITTGTPMALLEDVLVPVYFYHRYQLEAVTKWVGGMNYQYALRGDGQLVTAPLSKADQLKALNAVIDCMDTKFLELPERIVKLIPPRPAGYDFSRELFHKRTGLAFDALAPAETGADFPLSFLFNPQRVSRMVEYEALNKGLGLDEMINTLFNRTWKAPRRAGMQGLIQQQTEQVLLTYLLALSLNENASYGARAVVQKSINDLKKLIEQKVKETKEEGYAAHLALALERLKAPEKAKPTIHQEIPPGAPIGCDWDGL
jgi:hypothetical protein